MAKDNKITIKVDTDMSGFEKALLKMRDAFEKGQFKMGEMPLMHVMSKSQNSAHHIPYMEDVKEPVAVKPVTEVYKAKGRKVKLEACC